MYIYNNIHGSQSVPQSRMDVQASPVRKTIQTFGQQKTVKQFKESKI